MILPIGSPVDLRTMHQSMLPLSYWRTHDPMILLVCITSLWGSQVANLVTSGSDIQFLKHMTETMARYAGFDLVLSAEGDNDHHIIEDTAITLGKALRQAMGDEPIERMATAVVPMDDALVMSSLDLVDRPYADIDLPDPIYIHFMRSFAMAAGMTLHIVQIRGFDEHHLVEAGFKATGKALAQALRVRGTELSTKDREIIS